ncbi:M20 metallopeptidase family protein [Allobaculum mucilyticum]|uniref:M20 metallopeptidase family protein n=1 Tax=Allobaculum mucilyticum TaxID=2834459 RepID=UPI001E49F670|nr:M20 family metallopeptidase [Allobaculum mucilyticum]UNT97099.1 amidohydrolase [Allobaculum mucilyticum]
MPKNNTEGSPASLAGQNPELEQVIEWRRTLHQIPEVALDVPRTCDYILSQLEGLYCTITQPIDYSVAAFFDAGKDTTIAFRSDMDGLPVDEKTGVEFASKHPGRMHACGHDGHMSSLLLLAHRLNSFYRTLDHNVLLIFQPGEETPGGAQPILDTGLFEEKNVQAVFGLHLWPHAKKGTVTSRPGPLMSKASEIYVDIKGKAAHAARYQEGIDALEIATRFVQQAYALEASLPDDVYRLLRFGIFQAGRAMNVVADTCHLEGTLRAFEDEYFDELQEGIEQIRKSLEEQSGAQITVTYSSGYPAVLNDQELYEKIEAAIPGIERLEKPVMISEDFAAYQRAVPGVFFFLGTGTGIELHDSHFDFEEDLLLSGADLFEKIARMKF